MAVTRISRLQQQILRWLAADHRRTWGMIASSHQELVQALQGDKGNISRSLQTLERHGLVIIGRSPGGYAESLLLTPAGHQRAAQLPGSCD
jgi:DNA-binding MarR family transcriptional regulator